MSHPDYLLIGHITADIIHQRRVLGGTVSFAASVAHAFGNDVALLTSCAPDEPLIRSLLSYAEIANRVAYHTTTFENIYQGENRFQTVHHIASPLTISWLPQGWQKAKLVHFAPLVGELDPRMAEHFPDAVTLLTPQGMLRQWNAEGAVSFKRWCDPQALQSVDIVVMSKQDIAAAPELEAEYAALCKVLVVTDGAHGGIYYLNGESHTYHAYPAIENHPTGAGDAFATALLASLPHVEHDIHRAISIGAQVAALIVARPSAGTILSTAQIRAILPIHP